MESKRKTPNDLADFMGWSSAEQFHKWRRGAYRISRQNATRLAEFLAVGLEELDPSGESFDMENRGPQQARRIGKTPIVPAQPTDTNGAALAHAQSESPGGVGVSDPHWADLEAIYRVAIRGLSEEARKQLVDALEEEARRFKERMREGAKKDKAVGE